MITGMSYGALSHNAKRRWRTARRTHGHLHHHRRRRHARPGAGGTPTQLIYEVLPSRYGIDVAPPAEGRRRSSSTIGQGAKPGTGGLLLGSRCRPSIAEARDLPPGVDQRSPCRHPDFLGPDDLLIKIEELREATDWRVPIFVKIGACRVSDDVKLAAKAGADVIVIDGMEGGTGASPDSLMDHTGIPTLAGLVRGCAPPCERWGCTAWST